ncbi:MAG TPA: tryptophan synthase subunit alpha [Clostridia bacterium]|nr:tryptophan synthase subunit alpha [Clostridia bacterium]
MIKIVSKYNIDAVKDGKKLLVGYLLAGYPQKSQFLEVAAECEAAGVDIFEVGFPSTDPQNDGEVIQKAHQRIDASVSSDMEYWQEIRRTISKPIWVMGYKCDLIDTGIYGILAQKKLIDALVIPDISFQERQKLSEELSGYSVDIVGFVNPDMNEAELKECFSNTALVYQQLYTGPTGMPVVSDDYVEILNKAREYKHVKVFAGFGITTPQRVNQLLTSGFDGVIIGTAMIKKLNESERELTAFIKELNSSKKRVGEGDAVYCNL